MARPGGLIKPCNYNKASAIILDSRDGNLSGFGMMNLLPLDERLQGAMDVCNVDAFNIQCKPSLLS